MKTIKYWTGEQSTKRCEQCDSEEKDLHQRLNFKSPNKKDIDLVQRFFRGTSSRLPSINKHTGFSLHYAELGNKDSADHFYYKLLEMKESNDVFIDRIKIDMVTFVKEHIKNRDIDYIVHVPQNGNRNHVADMTNYIGQQLNIPVFNALERVLETAPQHSIKSRYDRRVNVRSSLAVNLANASDLMLNSIFIIDDVWDSGATMNVAVEALQAIGVAKITYATICQTNKDFLPTQFSDIPETIYLEKSGDIFKMCSMKQIADTMVKEHPINRGGELTRMKITMHILTQIKSYLFVTYRNKPQMRRYIERYASMPEMAAKGYVPIQLNDFKDLGGTPRIFNPYMEWLQEYNYLSVLPGNPDSPFRETSYYKLNEQKLLDAIQQPDVNYLELLKQLSKEHSNLDLAQLLNIPPSKLSKIVNNKQKLDEALIPRIRRLANILK